MTCETSAEQFGLLDYMPIGGFVLRQDFIVMFWNNCLENWTGIRRGQIVGRPIGEFFPHLASPRYAARIQNVFENGIPVIFSPYLHKYIIPVTLSNQQLQIQSTTVTRLPMAQAAAHVLFSISDVTELAHRIKDYQEARRAAEEANQAKSRFLASMSHELRTPLNAILGFAQLMTRSRALPIEEQNRLNIIIQSGEHLLNLINQVLDLSKIEAGKMTLHERTVELRVLLDDTAEMFRLRAQDKGLHFWCDCDPSVPQHAQIDDTKLRQILLNLLGNALKFTPEGGVSFRVRVGGEPQPDSPALTLICEVEDTGPGMTAEEVGALFHAFTQTSAGQQFREGTGLGLALSRKFARLLGGDLTAQSQPGRGACFTCVTPVTMIEQTAQAALPPSRRIVALQPDQPRYRLLIVDENAVNRQLFIQLLQPLGFTLREAEHGEQAIAMWETWQPDCIFMDVFMPVMDGFEAARRIRAIEAQRGAAPDGTPSHVKIIAVTASIFESELTAFSAGCDGFLRKPFKETAVFELLRQRLGVRYVYEDDAPKNARPTLNLDALTALPTTLLEAIRNAARTTNITVLLELVREVEPISPAAADALSILLSEFNYATIIEMIDRHFHMR